MTFPIDPLLYLSFAIGLAAHRFLPAPARWLDRAMLGIVYVLVTLLGEELAQSATAELLPAIPLGVASAVLLVGISGLIAWRLSRNRGPWRPGRASPHAGQWIGLSLVVAFIAGFAIGRIVTVDAGLALRVALYVLLGLVGWGLRWSSGRLTEVWIPLTACVVSSAVVAAFLVFVGGESVAESLATTLAFGFYSLAGPLLAAHSGAAIGFIAFLTNFLRENLTMVTSPFVGPRAGPDTLVAMGGATSMDTTLYFVTTFGDADSAGLALTSGLALTVLATLALPLLVAI